MLYERNSVAVHPRGAPGYLDFGRRGAVGVLSTEITGRLALTRTGGVLHLSWSPTSPQPLALPPAPHGAGADEASAVPGATSTASATVHQDGRKAAEREAYAVHSIPVADICALKRHTPTIGFHFVIVVLHSGVALPPFYFHEGGVREFLAVLKENVDLTRSAGARHLASGFFVLTIKIKTPQILRQSVHRSLQLWTTLSFSARLLVSELRTLVPSPPCILCVRCVAQMTSPCTFWTTARTSSDAASLSLSSADCPCPARGTRTGRAPRARRCALRLPANHIAWRPALARAVKPREGERRTYLPIH